MANTDDALQPVLEGLQQSTKRKLYVMLYAAPALGMATWMVTLHIATAGVVFGLMLGGALIVAHRVRALTDSPLMLALRSEPDQVETVEITTRPGKNGGIYTMLVRLRGKKRHNLYLPSRDKMETALKVFHERCPKAELKTIE